MKYITVYATQSLVKGRYKKHLKMHIFKTVYLLTLMYASESCVPLNKHLNRVNAGEMLVD